MYYLQSRYYDPEVGRFLNADAYTSTEQGVVSCNMFAYCLNNPVNFADTSGKKAEAVTNNEENDEDGYRLVGGGVQLEGTAGYSSLGWEFIIYWDPVVAGDGCITVAIYSYNGFSFPMEDAFLASIIGIITDNASLLDLTDESVHQEFLLLVGALISEQLSVGFSGVLVFGNEDFSSPESYSESFTSVDVSWGWARGSYAYSETCRAVAFGGNMVGGSFLPSWGVSKTYYYLVYERTIVLS